MPFESAFSTALQKKSKQEEQSGEVKVMFVGNNAKNRSFETIAPFSWNDTGKTYRILVDDNRNIVSKNYPMIGISGLKEMLTPFLS